MKRSIVFLKMLFYAMPIYLSSLHSIKATYHIRYEAARLWTFIYLKAMKVKIKVHHRNYLPLKEGVLLIVQQQTSIDQEICMSVFSSPFLPFLSIERRLFLISKAWQKRLNATLMNDINELSMMDDINIGCFIDHIDSIPDALLQMTIKNKYPIMLIDIEDKQRAIDRRPSWRAVVDVYMNIPIVYEEYKDISLTQLKHMLTQRKEGTIYEHD